jgi:uncharacterized protein DUF3429
MLNSLFGDIRNDPLPPIERQATILAYSGLVPFFALFIVVWLTPGLIDIGPGTQIIYWGMMYGAILLSFMGGIHWGIALMQTRENRDLTSILERFSGSLLPAIIGWIAIIPSYLLGPVIIPSFWRFALMLFAFIYLLIADQRSVRNGLLPKWYGRLREKITFFLAMILLLIIVRLFQLYQM